MLPRQQHRRARDMLDIQLARQRAGCPTLRFTSAGGPSVSADPTRRVVLAASAALPLLVAGCRGTQVLGTPPQLSAAVRHLRAAIAAEQSMVASYQRVLALLTDGRAAAGSGPAARATLAGLLAEHQDHLRQLRARLIPGSPQAAGCGPRPAPSVTGGPATPRQAISYLGAAEQAASDRLLSGVLQVPPSLAQLFASISASEATHVPVLAATEATQ
jgi:outer membrane murein-binding lipoprotein Lpp